MKMAVQVGGSTERSRAATTRARFIGRSIATLGTLRLKCIKSMTSRRCAEIGTLRPQGLDILDREEASGARQRKFLSGNCQRRVRGSGRGRRIPARAAPFAGAQLIQLAQVSP